MKYTAHQIQGGRAYQEDFYAVDVTDPDKISAAVFDGHGGHQCAQKLCNGFTDWMQDNTNSLTSTFKVMNEMSEMDTSGCACSAIHADKTTLWAAVLGDCPVIVKQKDGPVTVLPNHNARTNLSERAAAVGRGADYWSGYLMNRYGMGLQMARAFGDASLPFLSRDPDILRFDNWEWCLLGSDGMLDSHDVTLETAKDLITVVESGGTASNVVHGSPKDDNVTAIVIRNE